MPPELNNTFPILYNTNKKKINNQADFLKKLSELLIEGYTFEESLRLLIPHHCSQYETIEKQLLVDFKSGFGPTKIFENLGFSPDDLLPIAIAEIDGTLADALNSLAMRILKRGERKKKLMSILAYPFILLFFISALLLSFKEYFLPNLELLASSRPATSTSIIDLLPSLVTRIPDVLLGLLILTVVISSIILYRLKNTSPLNQIELMLKIPVLKSFFPMFRTRDFASELGSLLNSGLSIQNALEVLITQQQDGVISTMAQNIKERIIFGDEFHAAVQITPGFTKLFFRFVKHGENSGYLAKELLLYSNHLTTSIDEKLSKVFNMIQPILFSIIAICILAAYLALLLPVYRMMDQF